VPISLFVFFRIFESGAKEVQSSKKDRLLAL